MATFWKPRIVIRFFMKGGSVVDVPCRDYKLRWRKEGGELTGYEFTDMPKNSALITLKIDEVVAVQRIK